jgi:hypothetical protein
VLRGCLLLAVPRTPLGTLGTRSWSSGEEARRRLNDDCCRDTAVPNDQIVVLLAEDRSQDAGAGRHPEPHRSSAPAAGGRAGHRFPSRLDTDHEPIHAPGRTAPRPSDTTMIAKLESPRGCRNCKKGSDHRARLRSGQAQPRLPRPDPASAGRGRQRMEADLHHPQPAQAPPTRRPGSRPGHPSALPRPRATHPTMIRAKATAFKIAFACCSSAFSHRNRLISACSSLLIRTGYQHRPRPGAPTAAPSRSRSPPSSSATWAIAPTPTHDHHGSRDHSHHALTQLLRVPPDDPGRPDPNPSPRIRVSGHAPGFLCVCQAAGRGLGDGLVDFGLVGPGSDLSEEPAVGVEPVALDVRVAPVCPPGPVPASRSSRVIRRHRWSARRRLRQRIASLRVFPAAIFAS